MKTRIAETRSISNDVEVGLGPDFEVTVVGVGTRTLPLPFAFAILLDSYTKGRAAVSYDPNGEPFIEVTRDRKFIGESVEAIEFKNWAVLMFQMFETYLAVMQSPLPEPELALEPLQQDEQAAPAPVVSMPEPAAAIEQPSAQSAPADSVRQVPLEHRQQSIPQTEQGMPPEGGNRANMRRGRR